MSLVDFGKRLLECARLGDTEEVSLLMTNGAPFTTDWLGTSPLHMAAEHGHVATAEVLLRAGISRDARTKVDRTPLHVAAQEGHTEIVELLIKHGAEVDAKDMLQMTPLHWAVERGHISVVSSLLKHNADVFATSKFGKTPIDIAEDYYRMDILEILKEQGSGSLQEKQEQVVSEQLHVQQKPKVPQLLLPKAVMPFNIVKTESLANSVKKTGMKKIVNKSVMDKDFKNVKTRTALTGKACLSAKTSAKQLHTVFLQTNEVRSNVSKGSDTRSSCESDEGESSEQSCTNVLTTLAALAEATAPNSTISNQEAMQWLEMHGITMLPPDNSTIVASALESGHTLCLTEAGKLALSWIKEQKNVSHSSTAPSPEVSAVHSSLPDLIQTNQLITIVTDKSHMPSIISSQQLPILAASSQDLSCAGIHEEQPIIKKAKLDVCKKEIVLEANGKTERLTPEEEERLLLQIELEETKKQAAEYKAQLILKEHEAEEYRKQLELLKNASASGNL